MSENFTPPAAPSAAEAAAIAQWKSRPVFISSTFRDMQWERDYLNRVVFPRLAEELAKRHHHLEPIDLRLGVEAGQAGSEEARELLVLKVCLDEIKRSRPFLLVLLGDRYGWVPPPERIETAAREQGMETSPEGKSVTALEIEFGILRDPENPDQKSRSLFFFRQPLPYADMPDAVRADYSDAHSPDPQARAGHAKLTDLKAALQRDPELAGRLHDYSVGWDAERNKVTDLEAFGDLVFEKLWAVIDAETKDWAAKPAPTWEEQERASLAEFIEHRSRGFTGREDLLEKLRAIATSSTATPPASPTDHRSLITDHFSCLTGTPGSGKSAVFAQLHRDLEKDPSLLILSNAAGGTQRGSSVDSMLRRWIGELAAAAGVENTLPANASNDDVEAAFYSLLHRVAGQRRVVALLDALDQFEPTPRGRHLTWFKPQQWPPNARLIATAIPGTASEVLVKLKGTTEFDLPPLTAADAQSIGEHVWGRYHRTLNPAVLAVLIEKPLPDGTPACGNPLWLTLALEQLNLLDADDFIRAERDFTGSPGERLAALLLDTARRMPPDIEALYGWLLQLNEKVFGAVYARAFAVVITLGRIGWRETDLLALIPPVAKLLLPTVEVSAIDDLALASIRRGFRSHLTRRGTEGQLDFFHAQMRQAVHARLLSDGAVAVAVHRVIADYLVRLNINDPLRESELMAHLVGGGDAEHAAEMLANSLRADGPYHLTDLHGFASGTPAILTLAQHISHGLGEDPNPNLQWTLSLLARPGLSDDQLWSIATRLETDLDKALAKTADLRTRQTVLEATRDAFRRLADRDATSSRWQESLARSLNRLGRFVIAQGDISLAQRCFEESRAIGERQAAQNPAGDATPPAPVEADEPEPEVEEEIPSSLAPSSQRRLREIYSELRENKERLKQMASQRRQLSVMTNMFKLSDQEELCESLDNLGDTAVAKGDVDAALRYFNQSLTIRQQIAAGDPFYNQWLDDLAIPADQLPSDESAHYLRIQWQFKMGVSYLNLGYLAMRMGELDEAHHHFTKHHIIVEGIIARYPQNILADHAAMQSNLAEAKRGLGHIAEERGDLEEAFRIFSEIKVIEEQLVARNPADLERQDTLAATLSSLGGVAKKQGNLVAAMRCFSEQHVIAERISASDPTNLKWQRTLCMSHGNLGSLAQAQGNYAQALRSSTAAYEIACQMAADSPEDAAYARALAFSHCSLANLAHAMGDQIKRVSHLYACHGILREMRRQNKHFDSWMTQAYEQVSSMKQRGIMLPTDEQYLAALREKAEGEPENQEFAPAGRPALSPPSNPNPAALALLKEGRVQEALEMLRAIIFPNETIDMDHRSPLEARVAFVHALWLSDNVEGVLRFLPSLPEQTDPRVQALSRRVADWQQGLSTMQKLGFKKKPPLPTPPSLEDIT